MKLRGRKIGIALMAVCSLLIFGMYWSGVLPPRRHGQITDYVAILLLAGFHMGVVRTFQRFGDADKHQSRPLVRLLICGSAGYIFAHIGGFKGAELVFALILGLLGLAGRHARPYPFSVT
jgi:hypothetical protein